MAKPRVDFYLLSKPAPLARLEVAGRLTDKAYNAGHQVYIYCNSLDEAKALDDLLWVQREDSFLPHAIYKDGASSLPPIVIGLAEVPLTKPDVLINLTLQNPTFYPHFQRVIEIVPPEEALRQQARHNYKLYREQGCQLASHNL